MRLIDADALKMAIKNEYPLFRQRIGIRPVFEAIRDAPNIEAEPVIRCKDCINFIPGKDEWGSCFENPMKMWRTTDYCAWAERRDDGTN